MGIKEAHIVGLSMGGSAAVNFAILYPEMTFSVIPVDSSLGGYNYSQELINALSSLPKIAKEKGIQAAKEFFLKTPIFQHAMKNDTVSKNIHEMFNTYTGWHWVNQDTGRPMNPPAIERLSEIKAPALVIVGEHDTPDFHGIADVLETKIPNAKKVVIRGAGHIVNMEATSKFNEIVLGFLKNQKNK